MGSFSCDNRYLVVVVGPVVVGVGHISRKRLEQETAGQSSNIQKLSLVILTIVALNLVETINICWTWMTQLSIECIKDGSDLGKKFGWQSHVKGNRAICLEEEREAETNFLSNQTKPRPTFDHFACFCLHRSLRWGAGLKHLEPCEQCPLFSSKTLLGGFKEAFVSYLNFRKQH